MKELISIIMPSFNSDKYIRNSITSVINQTYTNWELIIVDDCSNDKTVEIINDFKDSRIKLLVNNQNSGAALSRNKGLREAQGEWIAFLDSDDTWHPKKLERQLKFMLSNGYSFTYTDYKIQNNGKWLPYIYTAPNHINRRKIYNYCYFSTITVMYNRNVVGLIQIENLRKNNDYAMWLKAIEKTDFHRLPECLSYYIKHDSSISSGSKIKLIKWHYILFRKGLHRSAFISVIFTLNNLFHGVLKKFIYRKKTEEN